MKTAQRILGGFILCLLAFQVQATDKNEQIHAMLEQSGFNKLLQHVPDFAQAVLKQSSGALEPEMNSALSAVFLDTFAAAAVKRDVIDVIDANYDEDHAGAYIKLLHSPLSIKMAELERNTSDPANLDNFRAFAASRKETPAAPARRQLIQRLDDANRTTEFSVDMQTAFFKAIFIAIDPVMDSELRLRDGELEKMVEEVRDSLNKNLRNNTHLSYLYAFRNVSDDDLESYIRMCESESYRWAIQLLSNAMLSALNQAADRAASAMSAAAHSEN